jgi:hypothetical protein
MTSSLPKRKRSKRQSRRNLDWLPAGPAGEKYRQQILAQGVNLDAPAAKAGRYTVSAEAERTVDGVVFDSKHEARIYLRLCAVFGKDRVRTQVPFELLPAFELDGKKHRAIAYIADFVLDDIHVIDAKGHLTGEFKMKHKLFLHRYRRPLHLFYKESDVDAFAETVGIKR